MTTTPTTDLTPIVDLRSVIYTFLYFCTRLVPDEALVRPSVGIILWAVDRPCAQEAFPWLGEDLRNLAHFHLVPLHFRPRHRSGLPRLQTIWVAGQVCLERPRSSASVATCAAEARNAFRKNREAEQPTRKPAPPRRRRRSRSRRKWLVGQTSELQPQPGPLVKLPLRALRREGWQQGLRSDYRRAWSASVDRFCRGESCREVWRRRCGRPCRDRPSRRRVSGHRHACDGRLCRRACFTRPPR